MDFKLRDGVRLAYEESSVGQPPLVFIHGWCCDHTYFALQAEHFSGPYRTLAVDLRGHGASGAPRQDYTMEGFADDLVWLFQELGLDRPVLVGHSMGGVIGLTLACRYPNVARAVIMIDSPLEMLTTESESRKAGRAQFVESLRGSAYQEVARRVIERMFLPTDDAVRRDRIIADMLATPSHVMASAFEHMFACQLVEAAPACNVPILYIQAGAARPAGERLLELFPNAMLARTAGAGHFNQLEVPEQVNAMIERFLLISCSG